MSGKLHCQTMRHLPIPRFPEARKLHIWPVEVKNLGQDCGNSDRSTEGSWTIGVDDILNEKDKFLGEKTIN